MSDFKLVNVGGILSLLPTDKSLGGALAVDFNCEKANYRRKTSGIKQEIAKACGVKQAFRPRILDLTAGLAADAFVLASLGCHVSLVERNPQVFALLKDGFARAELLDNEVASIVGDNMQLYAQADSLHVLATIAVAEFDCIYLDPMFPQREKSAKVKKAMQYFHAIVGIDEEQDAQLLTLALEKAAKRVVVKRPKLAPCLTATKPSLSIKSKTLRYDIYLCHNEA